MQAADPRGTPATIVGVHAKVTGEQKPAVLLNVAGQQKAAVLLKVVGQQKLALPQKVLVPLNSAVPLLMVGPLNVSVPTKVTGPLKAPPASGIARAARSYAVLTEFGVAAQVMEVLFTPS